MNVITADKATEEDIVNPSTNNKAKNNTYLYVGMILAAGIMWGCIGIFIRNLNAFGYTSRQISAIRCVITLPMMFLLVCLTNKKRLRIEIRDIGLFAANGICSLLVCYTAYQASVTLTSMPTAVALLYTAPAFVMLFSVLFFHEKITVIKGTALVLSVAGSALASGIAGGVQFQTAGILLGLFSGLGYALYSIIGTVILRKYHPFTNIFYSFLFASAGILCICDLPDLVTKVKMEPASIPWMLGCSAVTCFFSYLLYTVGLSVIPASRAAIYACIEPVVATVIGIIIYKERTGTIGIIGIVMVIAAILLLNLTAEKR